MLGDSLQGWIFDAYTDYERNSLVLWLRTESGVHRIEDSSFRAPFYVHAPLEELQDLRRRLEILDGVENVLETKKRTDIGECDPRIMLEVHSKRYEYIKEIARIIDSNGRYHNHKLFNVDLRLTQRYFLEKGVFPMGLMDYYRGEWRALEDQFALEYSLPPLSTVLLDVAVRAEKKIPRFQDKLLSVRLDEEEVDGDEETILRGLNNLLKEKDPDVILTDGGDVFTIPYLARRAELLNVDLRLGREPQRLEERRGKSYFTYGRIVYKPGKYVLKGRLHLDRGHFTYRESGMVGLAELSRLSALPPQEQARLTPGTAITAMQVNQALKDGCLVRWKKNLPESFKTAEELIRADRGGFIFEPEVGVHDNIVELDFASLYPNIMMKHNLSLETLNCKCCAATGPRVPELGYHTCRERFGLIPRVLRPLLERKRYYKRMKREEGPWRRIYEERDTILKWVLVTCLDGTVNVLTLIDGRIESVPISELVDPQVHDIGEHVPRRRFAVLSLDSLFRPHVVDVDRLFKFPAPEYMLKVLLDDGRELLITEDHPCFVFDGSNVRVTLACDITRGDRLPVLNGEGKLSGGLILSIKATEPCSDYVYCLGVKNGLPGFFIENGVLTHNCFGYQGFRNARFGRIECHEAINAYARETLIRSMEISERHGYEVVHGIVDSLWLRPTKSSDDLSKVMNHIVDSVDIPLDVEGWYKWIVFLPCKATGVGALNRYYGLLQNGELKLRGIELRRHDTPPFINRVQEAMLRVLSRANDAKEFLEKIPDAVETLRRGAKQLRDGLVPLEDLVMTKMVTRKLHEYVVMSNTVAALKQMESSGFSVEPGEYVRYVILNQKSKDPLRKVRVAEFIEGDEQPDMETYTKLLCRTGETLLAPFTYSEGKLMEMCTDLTDVDTVSSQKSEVPLHLRGELGYHPSSPRSVLA